MRIDGLNPPTFGRHLIVPILVTLQIVVAIASPLSHAYLEDITSQRAVETTHSTQCAVIHSEAQCSVPTFKHQYPTSPGTAKPSPALRMLAAGDVLARRPERQERICANGERAPPTS